MLNQTLSSSIDLDQSEEINLIDFSQDNDACKVNALYLFINPFAPLS